MAQPVGAIFREIRDIDNDWSSFWKVLAAAKNSWCGGVTLLVHQKELNLRSAHNESDGVIEPTLNSSMTVASASSGPMIS